MKVKRPRQGWTRVVLAIVAAIIWYLVGNTRRNLEERRVQLARNMWV